jgi:hypothetical protein
MAELLAREGCGLAGHLPGYLRRRTVRLQRQFLIQLRGLIDFGRYVSLGQSGLHGLQFFWGCLVLRRFRRRTDPLGF